MSRQRRECESSVLGVFAKGRSGRVAARVFLRFRDIEDVRAIPGQVPIIARKARTSEDYVWYCLYYRLKGFGQAPQA